MAKDLFDLDNLDGLDLDSLGGLFDKPVVETPPPAAPHKAEVIQLPTAIAVEEEPFAIKLPTSYLSPSQINMYRRCPLQYYYRYHEGLKVPPGFNLTWGSAIHVTNEFNYAQKIESHEDKSVSELKEYFASTWQLLAKDTVFGDDDPTPGELLDQGVLATEAYYNEIARHTQPVACEEKFKIQMAGVPVVGVIDLRDDQSKLRDTKTKGKSPNKVKGCDPNNPRYEVEPDYHFQMTTYKIGCRARGIEESGIQLDMLIRTKEPKTLQVPVNVTDQDVVNAEKLVRHIVKAISNDIWYPNPNSTLCSPKFCGYWDLCKGGKWA